MTYKNSTTKQSIKEQNLQQEKTGNSWTTFERQLTAITALNRNEIATNNSYNNKTSPKTAVKITNNS